MHIHTVEFTVGIVVGGVHTTVVTLHGGEHGRGRNSALLTFGHIHINEILGIVGAECCHRIADFGALIEGGQEVVCHLGESFHAATGAVLHRECQTVRHRETLNHRRLEGQNLCALDRGCLLVDHAQYGVRLLGKATVFKRFQLKDECTLVGTLSGNEVVTRDAQTVLDGRVGDEHGVDLVHHLVGGVKTGAGRHGYGAEHGTCIFVGDKTRAGVHRCDAEDGNGHDDRDAGDDLMLDDAAYAVLVSVEQFVVGGVECRMETVYLRHLALFAVLVFRLEQDGTEGRREGQRVECRDDDGYGHGHTKLAVERS